MAMEMIVEKKDNVGLWMNIIDEMQSYYDQRAPIYDESMGYNESDKSTASHRVYWSWNQKPDRD